MAFARLLGAVLRLNLGFRGKIRQHDEPRSEIAMTVATTAATHVEVQSETRTRSVYMQVLEPSVRIAGLSNADLQEPIDFESELEFLNQHFEPTEEVAGDTSNSVFDQ